MTALAPSFASCSCTRSEKAAAETLFAITPSTNAKAPLASSHAIRLPRSPRRAWAVGEPSRPRRGSASSRACSSPLPTSRRSAIAAETPSRIALETRGRSSTAGRGSANARSSSIQPSGVAQRSAVRLDVSATTRRRNAAASAPLPSSRAIRRFGASWLTSAPTPTNTGMTATTASAR